MRKCLGKHSCMSSPFSIAILNDTSFFFRQCNYKCTKENLVRDGDTSQCTSNPVSIKLNYSVRLGPFSNSFVASVALFGWDSGHSEAATPCSVCLVFRSLGGCESVFSLLEQRGDSTCCASLTLQYRMNGEVCRLSNLLTYHGKLTCATADVSESRLTLHKQVSCRPTMAGWPALQLTLWLGWLSCRLGANLLTYHCSLTSAQMISARLGWLSSSRLVADLLTYHGRLTCATADISEICLALNRLVSCWPALLLISARLARLSWGRLLLLLLLLLLLKEVGNARLGESD